MGMLLFWTVGGGIHSAYNLFMWYLAACACCREGGCCEPIGCCPSFGKQMLRILVAISTGFSVVIILLRVEITNENDEAASQVAAEKLAERMASSTF